MEPAQTIIKRLGGPSVVAKVVGVHRTRVSSWQRERARGGTDGRIPQNHISLLLTFAREQGIALAPEEFYGGTTPASPPTSPDQDTDQSVGVES